MDQLPTLLVHGPMIWTLIAIGSGLLAAAIAIAIRFGLAKLAGARAGRAIRTDRSALLGVLRGEPGAVASTIAIDAYGIETIPTTSTASWHAPKLWLETADRTIALVGSIDVISGSQFRGRRRKLPPLPPEGVTAINDQLPWIKSSVRSALVQSLHAGDEVAVVGLPQPHAGQGESTNREAAIEWSLEGTADKPLRLAAARPRAPRLPLGLFRIALAFAAGLGVYAIVKNSLGDGWEKACGEIRWAQLDRQARSADGPIELTNDHPCVLAASVRSDQSYVLSGIHELIERHPYRDPATVRLLTELARETKSCESRVRSLFYSGRYEATVEEARLCGDRHHEHLGLVALGRIEEALAIDVPPPDSDLPFEPLPALETLIAGKRWTAAAARLDARVAEAEHESYRLHAQCIAELFRHHGGDGKALDRLRALIAESDNKECLAILAQVDPAARPRWIDEDFHSSSIGADRLHAAEGLHRFTPTSRFEDLLINPEDNLREAAWVWLRIEGTTPGMRILKLRQQATAAAFDNDIRAARAYAEQAIALAASLAADQRRDDAMTELTDVPWLRRAVALYSDEVFPARVPKENSYDTYYGRLFFRSSLPLEGFRLPYDQHLQDVFAEVKRSGDTKLLLPHLRPLGIYWADGDLLALLPHLKMNRDVLARELPYFPPQRGLDSDLFAHALRAVVRRELFEQLGVTDQAAAWDAVYRRFDRVFEDRDVIVALSLLH